MPRNEWYRHCKLRRETEDGTEITTTWLPDDKRLRKGARVRIKDHRRDPWDDGWVVEQAGTRMAGALVEANEDEYRYHRTVTDV